MSFDRFHNSLRILLNIDADEFLRATTGKEMLLIERASDDWREWETFQRNPHLWFIKAPTEKARAIWALVEARQKPDPLVTSLNELAQGVKLAEKAINAGYGRHRRYPNGAPMFAPDGTMLDDKGNRSIFDDVDK